MPDTLAVVGIVILGAGLVLIYLGLPLVLSIGSHPEDGPRIKRDLDGPGHRVVELRRTGTEIVTSGLQAGAAFETYRQYLVVQELPDGACRRRQVGVRCTLIREPEVWEYVEGRRSRLIE